MKVKAHTSGIRSNSLKASTRALKKKKALRQGVKEFKKEQTAFRLKLKADFGKENKKRFKSLVKKMKEFGIDTDYPRMISEEKDAFRLTVTKYNPMLFTRKEMEMFRLEWGFLDWESFGLSKGIKSRLKQKQPMEHVLTKSNLTVPNLIDFINYSKARITMSAKWAVFLSEWKEYLKIRYARTRRK